MEESIFLGLAEMHEREGRPDQAAWCREVATEAREDALYSEGYDHLEAFRNELINILSGVPAPTRSTKHSETCWQRHAHCLVVKVATELDIKA